MIELIKSGMEIPPGVILFEDPPAHDLHRSLLSRVSQKSLSPGPVKAVAGGPGLLRLVFACGRGS